MRAENIRYQLPIAEETFFDHHPLFFTCKSSDECSAVCKYRKECLTGIAMAQWCNKTSPFLNFPIVKGGTKTIAHI